LNPPPSNESRIELAQHFRQGQWDHYAIQVLILGKKLWRRLPQVAEGDLHAAAGELCQDLIERDAYGEVARIAVLEARTQFQRKPGQNGLHGQFDDAPVVVSLVAGC
jgi:hypothetical protein